MKNSCQQISHKSYTILIRDIINTLSNAAGNLYNKILDGFSINEDKVFYEEILMKNFFASPENKSIYYKLHKILFDFKNIIRTYICNITLLTNFIEVRDISQEIGSLCLGL